jgi:hypothetical protein
VKSWKVGWGPSRGLKLGWSYLLVEISGSVYSEALYILGGSIRCVRAVWPGTLTLEFYDSHLTRF